MGLTLILALILAWPTFGLSLVAWFVFVVLKSRGAAHKGARRRVTQALLAPILADRYSEFYEALDVPYAFGSEPTDDQTYWCGRHIANYIAHNPSETEKFVNGLRLWTFKGSSTLCDPIEAIICERDQAPPGEIHLIAWRAIEALTTRNNLDCFQGVDLSKVKRMLDASVDRQTLAKAASASRRVSPAE